MKTDTHTSERSSVAGARRQPHGLLISSGLIMLLSALFIGLFISSWPWLPTPASDSQKAQVPLVRPDGETFAELTIPVSERPVLSAQPQGITLVPLDGGVPRVLETPGYHYNRALPPLLTPSGQVVYGGDGIWLADPEHGQARRLAELPAEHRLTSFVLSPDGTALAWSSAPRVGQGTIEIFAGPVDQTTQVYQQASDQCPCLRVFAWKTSTASGNDELLLTDGLGENGSVQNGLWLLELKGNKSDVTASPEQIVANNPPQGPLAWSPHDNTLLYTTRYGYVPMAEDGSVPSELLTQSYANDLMLAALGTSPAFLQTPQVIVSAQEMHEVQVTREPVRYQSTPVTTEYHWINSPRFSPDGSLLAYIQFSVDESSPFTRKSQLYLTQIKHNGERASTTAPQMLAVAQAGYVELGEWLNEHIVTVLADGALYAFDVRQGALVKIVDIKTMP